MLIFENVKNKEQVNAVYGSISKLPERFTMVSEGSLRMADELRDLLKITKQPSISAIGDSPS